MIRNRKVGPALATALVASNMVGSGLFLLPATLATVGSITVLGWLIATAGALLIAQMLARLGQIAPRTGGPCAYASDALGPYMGFQAGMLYWMSCWIGNIAIAVAAIGYLANLFPALAPPLYSAIATVALIWLMTLVNILGPRLVCQVESAAIVIGLIPILLISTAGWFYFKSNLFDSSWNVSGKPAMQAVPDSLVLMFWAFTGLESASVISGSVNDPQRNVPIATIGGVLIAAIVYIAACSVVMGLIPADALAKSSAPFADAIRLILGPIAGTFVAIMALVKATGTLGGWILLTAQTGHAGAERGQFPALFGKLDRHGIPVYSLLFMAVLMSVVVFATMSPTLGQQFGKLIEVSVILCLLVYVYASLATWHYPVPRASSGRRRFDGAVALAAMVFCLWVIGASDTPLLALSGVIVFATCPLYAFVMRKQAKQAVVG